MNSVNLRRVDQTGSVLRKPVDGLLSWRSGKAPHGAGRPVLSTDDAKTCHGHCARAHFRNQANAAGVRRLTSALAFVIACQAHCPQRDQSLEHFSGALRQGVRERSPILGSCFARGPKVGRCGACCLFLDSKFQSSRSSRQPDPLN